MNIELIKILGIQPEHCLEGHLQHEMNTLEKKNIQTHMQFHPRKSEKQRKLNTANRRKHRIKNQKKVKQIKRKRK